MVHIRRGEALPIPIEDPAADCVRKWFAYHYTIEQAQLYEAIAQSAGDM